MRPTPGICDRCGFRYALSDLREEYVLGRRTGLFTCWRCHDKSHPQLDTRGVKTNDRQRVDNPRSDTAELETGRSVYGFNPVGADMTSVLTVEIGRVKVIT